MLPMLSFSQMVTIIEGPLLNMSGTTETIPNIPFLGVEEPNRFDSISEFTENMIRPHIEDTIKQEDLPMYLLSSEGDTVGIILTVKQVQNLDHTAEVANLLEKALIECDQLDVFYVRVIKDLGNQVTILEKQIVNLSEQSIKSNKIVKTLQEAVSKKERQLDISNDQLFNDEIIIGNLENDLKKQKVKTIAGFTTAGAVAVASIVLGILFGTR